MPTLPVRTISALPETWAPIPGYEGIYEVSTVGRVRSLDRLNGRGYRQPGVVLKASINGTYRALNLTRNGKCTKVRVHVLVCRAFNGEAPADLKHPQVRHLDGDELNLCPDNLEWGDYTDQRRDDLRNGRNHRRNRTHCPQGHEYTPANTYTPPSRPTSRYCLKCNRIRRRKS